jgi:hypothetical protein
MHKIAIRESEKNTFLNDRLSKSIPEKREGTLC